MKSKDILIMAGALFLLNITSGHSQDEEIVADGAEVILLAEGFKFTEGPAADRDGNVFFTDQPNNRIMLWSAKDSTISVYMENAGRANGLYLDNEGNLLACADEKSELWKIDKEKNVKVLVDGFNGKRLNGPNDLWMDRKGGIYFTDPYYQREYWERTEKEIESERVYYLSPDGQVLKIAAEGLLKPNGIIGTPDGKTLYISDIGAKETWSYNIAADGSLGDKTLFTNMGSDGMTIDNRGNVYLTGTGVTVFNKKGEKIKQIPIDENWTANVTFGGEDHKILFITAMDAVYGLRMKVQGVRWDQ